MKILNTNTTVTLENEVHFISKQFKNTLAANNIPDVDLKSPVIKKDFEKFTMFTDKRPVISSLTTIINK